MKRYDKKTGYEIVHKKREKISKIFSWEEFYNRYAVNHEEFSFWYNNKIIDLINLPNKSILQFGTKEKMNTFYFATPKELLNHASFDGRTLKEIWTELE